MACPQPVEADMRAFVRYSGFDPDVGLQWSRCAPGSPRARRVRMVALKELWIVRIGAPLPQDQLYNKVRQEWTDGPTLWPAADKPTHGSQGCSPRWCSERHCHGRQHRGRVVSGRGSDLRGKQDRRHALCEHQHLSSPRIGRPSGAVAAERSARASASAVPILSRCVGRDRRRRRHQPLVHEQPTPLLLLEPRSRDRHP
jgi:hypothetical protein